MKIIIVRPPNLTESYSSFLFHLALVQDLGEEVRDLQFLGAMGALIESLRKHEFSIGSIQTPLAHRDAIGVKSKSTLSIHC
jgi:hypothetical protein